jgi:hypothetical protein
VKNASSAVPVIAVSVLMLFGIFAGALWQSGLLRFTGTEASAKVVSAVTALVGGFIAAIVSLMGVLLKHSIDERAEGRLQVESQRNEVLRQDTEARLKLEAAIQALQLFAHPDGTLSAPVQRAGALFTLARLGQHDLTVSLVGELLSRNDLHAATAARLLDSALTQGNAESQREAFAVLYQHVTQFVVPGGFELPPCLLASLDELSPHIRDWTPLLLGKLLMARTRPEWSGMPFALNALVGAFVNAWANEKEPQIKDDAAGILAAVLAAFPQLPRVVNTRRGRVLVHEARDQTKDSMAISDAGRDVVVRLQAWVRAQGSPMEEVPVV